MATTFAQRLQGLKATVWDWLPGPVSRFLLKKLRHRLVDEAVASTGGGPFSAVPGLEDDLLSAMVAYRVVMRSHWDELSMLRLPMPAALEPQHVRGAVVYANRYEYLDALPQDAECAEVGVWKGDFSAEIMVRTRPRKLHLFDLDFDRFAVRERFQAEREKGVVEFHTGDSALTMRALPDASLDWVYVDAGHDYRSVRRDVDVAARKLKPEGVLVFNDYILWSHYEGRPYGVVYVVNEMCVREGWRVVAYCLSADMSCDIAITRAPFTDGAASA